MTPSPTRSARRAVTALAIGVAATGAVLASAASLGVTGNTLGAGTSVIASCDTDGVSLAYTHSYDTATGTYRTSAVTVSNINNACNGLRLDLTLRDSTNASLGSGSITSLSLPLGTTSATVTLASPANANAIVGAAVVIAR